MRGLYAPPRSIVAAGVAATTSAISSVCSRLSTVHGPAISAKCSPPTRRSADLDDGALALAELREASL